jgi:ornithine cyclodeaminase/alanine dehydrogenase-like protein (mu-crystallin family)
MSAPEDLLVTKTENILYLSSQDLDAIGLSMTEIVPILEAMFRLKAEGGTVLPPKIFFHRNGPPFYSSMVSSAPALGYAGCKWQSGDPRQSDTRGSPTSKACSSCLRMPPASRSPSWIPNG